MNFAKSMLSRHEEILFISLNAFNIRSHNLCWVDAVKFWVWNTISRRYTIFWKITAKHENNKRNEFIVLFLYLSSILQVLNEWISDCLVVNLYGCSFRGALKKYKFLTLFSLKFDGVFKHEILRDIEFLEIFSSNEL
jgi:hypothetical protein